MTGAVKTHQKRSLRRNHHTKEKEVSTTDPLDNQNHEELKSQNTNSNAQQNQSFQSVAVAPWSSGSAGSGSCGEYASSEGSSELLCPFCMTSHADNGQCQVQFQNQNNLNMASAESPIPYRYQQYLHQLYYEYQAMIAANGGANFYPIPSNVPLDNGGFCNSGNANIYGMVNLFFKFNEHVHIIFIFNLVSLFHGSSSVSWNSKDKVLIFIIREGLFLLRSHTIYSLTPLFQKFFKRLNTTRYTYY